MFKGIYLDGKRWEGKEYYSNGESVKFDGKYLDGKRWNGIGYDMNGNQAYKLKNGEGYVKEYDEFGGKFEGEYLNGKRNGKGKEYDYEGKLKFEGEYLYSHKLNGK